jgi:hypothetical protein
LFLINLLQRLPFTKTVQIWHKTVTTNVTLAQIWHSLAQASLYPHSHKSIAVVPVKPPQSGFASL